MMDRRNVAILTDSGDDIVPVIIERPDAQVTVTLGPDLNGIMVLRTVPMDPNAEPWQAERRTLTMTGDLARNGLVLASALAAVLYDL